MESNYDLYIEYDKETSILNILQECTFSGTSLTIIKFVGIYKEIAYETIVVYDHLSTEVIVNVLSSEIVKTQLEDIFQNNLLDIKGDAEKIKIPLFIDFIKDILVVDLLSCIILQSIIKRYIQLFDPRSIFLKGDYIKLERN